jgi:hypothetical protein
MEDFWIDVAAEPKMGDTAVFDEPIRGTGVALKNKS